MQSLDPNLNLEDGSQTYKVIRASTIKANKGTEQGTGDSLDTIEELDDKLESDIKEPSQYQVFLHNDDYTSMDFVVRILYTIFEKPYDEARRIMLLVHNQGIGLCGVYTQEIAETKVRDVQEEARQAGYPLRCSMHKV